MPQAFLRQQELPGEILHGKATNIFELASFEHIPDTILRVQLWRVGRQAFQMQPFGGSLSEELLNTEASLNASSIPHEQDLARDFSQQQLQEMHNIRPFVGRLLHLHEQATLRCESPNHGKMIACQRDMEHGRLDCPSALRYIAKCQYVQHRVFFADEVAAIDAGYHACGTCLKERHALWKQALEQAAGDKKLAQSIYRSLCVEE